MKTVLTRLVLAVFVLSMSRTLLSEDAKQTAPNLAKKAAAAEAAARKAEQAAAANPGDKAVRAAARTARAAARAAEVAARTMPADEAPAPVVVAEPPAVKPERKAAKPAEKTVDRKAEADKAADVPSAPAQRVIVVKEPPAKVVEQAAVKKAETAKKAKTAAVVELKAEAAVAVDAQAQQYEQMMRPKMWRELEFIRQNCDLAPEQRPKIKAAAEVSVKQAAKDFVRGMQNGRQGDVGKTIRNGLFKTLEETLTAEQMTRYREMGARRTASIKSVTIKSTVSRLDSFLYLSREQRDKISTTLSEKWQEGWEQWLMVSRYGGLYFPMIPDNDLLPHLSEQQKQVWQGAQKINPGGFWGGEQQPVDDAWWTGKEATEKPKAEASGADAKPAGEGNK